MKNEEKNIAESVSKKTHKISKQMSFSIVMVIVSLVILSVSTYAWFLISNTPKVQLNTFQTDTLGNLQIADVNGENNGPMLNASGEKDYKNLLTLTGSASSILSPVATNDGINFYKPIYNDNQNVSALEKLDADTTTDLKTRYIYEKTFYLRAGNDTQTAGNEKNFDIFLVGKNTVEDHGCFIKNSDDANEATAANAVRVSLTFYDGVTDKQTTIIYEPNSDVNTYKGVEETNMAKIEYDDTYRDGVITETVSAVHKQKSDKAFITTPESAGVRSDKLVTIKEGEDVRVTMRVWVDGEDEDCQNGIAADTIVGQIQFVSEENKTVEEETTTAAETP